MTYEGPVQTSGELEDGIDWSILGEPNVNTQPDALDNLYEEGEPCSPDH